MGAYFNKLEKITIKKNRTYTFSIHHIKVPFRSEVFIYSIPKQAIFIYADTEDGVIYKLNDERTGNWSAAFSLHDYCQQQTINSRT